MANEQLRVIVTLENSQYKREARETATATGQIGREAKATGTATGGLKQSMISLGSAAKLAVGGVALAAVMKFAGDSLRAFSDLNESLNAVEVSYGDAAEGIKGLGQDAAQSLGLSNAEFNSFAVQFSAFAQQIAGDGGDVVGVVEELSTRVSDFASVMNLEVAEAAQLFQSGLAGETEPLRKYGIDLSAAAVKAHALAVGIHDGSGEMTEQEKVLARHSALMAQTDKVRGDFARTSGEAANQERILNAELEDNKALLGQALLPLQQTWQQLQADTIPIIADLAIELGRYTGALTDAEAALLKFKTEEGHAVETADELLASISQLGSGSPIADWVGRLFDMTAKTEDWVAAMDEGITTAGLSEEQLHDLGLELTSLHEAGDLTEQQFQTLNDTLETQKGVQEQLERPISDNEQALYALGDASKDVAGGQAALTGEIEDGISALQRFEAEVRSQTDPLYALVEAERQLVEKTLAVKAAAAEHGEDSPEYVDALLDQAQAFEDLVAAQLTVAEQTGLTRAQYETHLRSMGVLTQEQIDLILAELDRVNAFSFTDKSMTVTIRTRHITGGGPLEGTGVRRQHGGHVERHRMFRGGEHNKPELMIIPGDAGQVFSHVDSRRLIGALSGAGRGGGDMIFHVAGNLDPDAVRVSNVLAGIQRRIETRRR